ncbi:hypothetical protein GR7B_00012 [Vibrio phage vB_VcorM_GR7B]|nr:hypothetical protein GR7B_00012 [Vibrio phage vB_VcorM_GR7B]
MKTIKREEVKAIEEQLAANKMDMAVIFDKELESSYTEEDCLNLVHKKGCPTYGTGKYRTHLYLNKSNIHYQVATTADGQVWIEKTHDVDGTQYVKVIRGDCATIAELVKAEVEHFDCPNTQVFQIS